MKKKQTSLVNLFNINPDTNSYMIEISLDNYAELFNGWDASPLKRRDLEPELLEYIEQCGSEIPIGNSVELYLYINESFKDIEKEMKSIAVIVNNFNIVLFLIKKSLKKLYRQILSNLLMSFLFLIIAYFIRTTIGTNDMFITILIEGIYIGGWVLLWEAFSLFFFDSYDIRVRKKMFLRFKNMDIFFKYISDPIHLPEKEKKTNV